MLSRNVAVRAARKAERLVDASMLRRAKKLERRERMKHGAGDCEKDCRFPSECFETLIAILKKEEDEKKEADKKAATRTHIVPAPRRHQQPSVVSEHWFPQRSGRDDDEDFEECR